MYQLCCVHFSLTKYRHIDDSFGFLWRIFSSACMFMIEILDSKSNGKLQ